MENLDLSHTPPVVIFFGSGALDSVAFLGPWFSTLTTGRHCLSDFLEMILIYLYVCYIFVIKCVDSDCIIHWNLCGCVVWEFLGSCVWVLETLYYRPISCVTRFSIRFSAEIRTLSPNLETRSRLCRYIYWLCSLMSVASRSKVYGALSFRQSHFAKPHFARARRASAS